MATIESAPAKTIVLESSDGDLFNVKESFVIQWETIKKMIDDGVADSIIPLPNVSSKILAKMIEYCKRHAQDVDAASASIEDLKNFDTEFVNVDKDTLVELMVAAYHLKFEKLVCLTCKAAADLISRPDQTLEFVRDFFQITNDFTPEELEELEEVRRMWP